MFGRFLKKNSQETLSLTTSYSVGVYFNDVRMSYVLLKIHNGELSLQAYKTVSLEKNTVVNSKIIEMDSLAANLKQLSKDFLRYTNRVVVSLPQSFVTIEYFSYNPDVEQSLEVEAEFRASKVSDLDEINFDYYLFEDEKNENGVQDNVILTIAKKDDVDSRMYLTEISGLDLQYLDVEGATRVNAYSFWINQEEKALENELIAIYDIGINNTQVIFSKKGRILYSSEIPIGASQLLKQLPECSNLSNQQILEVLRDDFNYSEYEFSISDVRKRLTQEIYRSIRVFYSQSNVTESDVSSIFLTGIGAKSFMLDRVLQDIAGINVQVLNPIEYVTHSLNREQLHADAFYLTVAFGLALRGLL